MSEQNVALDARSFLKTYGFPAGLMLFYVLFQLGSLNYGYHRDELYYIIMSGRLDFGYLELPALAPFLLFLVRSVLGSSLTAIHVLPALSGAAVILFTFRMARELGGSLGAARLAAVAATLAPQFLGSDSLYSYDYLDKLFWVMALYFLVRYFRRGTDRDLYLVGLAMGLGLLSKVSIVFLGGALILGLLLTRHRRLFARRPLYLAGGLAFIFAGPYLFWQVLHGWPTLEFYGHYASGKTYPVTALGFIGNQVMTMNPVACILWAAGLVFLWKKDKGTYRPLTLMYLALSVFFFAIQAKYYMLAPFYPVLFAAGAIMITENGARPWRRRAAATYGALIALSGLLVSPMARPVLPVEAFLRYTHGYTGLKQERHELRGLPQHFADRFGWPEFVEKCRAVYDSLSPREKAEAIFMTGNYGEASSINFFGKMHGLPEAISGHNQYFLWGPRGHSGSVVIAFSLGSREELLRHFESVEEAARTDVRYAMPYEYGKPIFICRGLKESLEKAWLKGKNHN